MKKFLIVALALLSQACVSVLPEAAPPSARYEVTDVAGVASDSAPVSWTLGVESPDATLAFNSAKIALSREAGRIEYYAGGEWVDRAPRLFSVALTRSFENTGLIRGVGTRTALPISTFVLQTDIRNLSVDHRVGGMTAKSSVFARLTNGRSIIYASKLFTAEAPVAADNAGAAAIALNEGLKQIQRDIVAWTFDEAERANVAKKK